jgi:hypothetical protein
MFTCMVVDRGCNSTFLRYIGDVSYTFIQLQQPMQTEPAVLGDLHRCVPACVKRRHADQYTMEVGSVWFTNHDTLNFQI